MHSSQSQQYLESFINYEHRLDTIRPREFKLDRMRRLLQALGDPQKDLRIVHVAGTKGKGSTCAMMAHILKEAGYRVGLYTSPHVNDCRERIRVLDKSRINPAAHDLFTDMITAEELGDVITQIRPAIEEVHSNDEFGRLSYFEVITAIALYFFREKRTDLAILETGLGGRLDATNATDSMVAVLTPISLEHTHLLGNTVEAIAREKAAIIKNDRQRVVFAAQEHAATEVIRERCRTVGVESVCADHAAVTLVDRTTHGQIVGIKTEKYQLENVSLPLMGRHQRHNCATAVRVIEILNSLGYSVSGPAMAKGLEATYWPLRFERISDEPTVILDAAHNAPSLKVLMDLVGEMKEDRRVTAIFGACRDKDHASMIETLRSTADDVIYVKADHPRAAEWPGALNVDRALDQVLQTAEKNRIIIVTGSIFVASEARRHILGKHLCTS